VPLENCGCRPASGGYQGWTRINGADQIVGLRVEWKCLQATALNPRLSHLVKATIKAKTHEQEDLRSNPVHPIGSESVSLVVYLTVSQGG